MRRREFITLLGGAAAAWPLAARAQQATMPTVGFLHPATSDSFVDRLRAFRQGLKDSGYVEGESVAIAYRWAENQPERLPELASDLVRRRVAVIACAGGSRAILALQAVTTSIPIVFAMGEDPVARGLVASIARPSGNLTGINFLNNELAAKRLEILRELVPGAVRVAVLLNPSYPTTAEATEKDVIAAAPAMGVQLRLLSATNVREIDAAFASLVKDRPDALFVAADPLFNNRRKQLVLQAMRHGLPAAYASREYADAGGLMSYGTDFLDTFRHMGVYVGRILKGARPADLPVLQPTKFELVINQMTARILGFNVPATLLARADEVIE